MPIYAENNTLLLVFLTVRMDRIDIHNLLDRSMKPVQSWTYPFFLTAQHAVPPSYIGKLISIAIAWLAATRYWMNRYFAPVNMAPKSKFQKRAIYKIMANRCVLRGLFKTNQLRTNGKRFCKLKYTLSAMHWSLCNCTHVSIIKDAYPSAAQAGDQSICLYERSLCRKRKANRQSPITKNN